MINSYNASTQTLNANEAVAFTTDRIRTGCTAIRSAEGNSFTLTRPGYYYVAVNADASTSDAAGNVVLELYQNGSAVLGAKATNYSAAAVNINNLAFSTIIQVRPTCCAVMNATNISVVNTGIASTVTNANIVITKIA